MSSEAIRPHETQVRNVSYPVRGVIPRNAARCERVWDRGIAVLGQVVVPRVRLKTSDLDVIIECRRGRVRHRYA